jgi:SAM-dependent methyltransferase
MSDVLDDSQLVSAAMNIYGAELESEWIESSGGGLYRSEFLQNGFHAFGVDPVTAEGLRGFFDDDFKIKFDIDDHADGYLFSDLPSEVVERINKDNIYYGKPGSDAIAVLEKYLKDIAELVERQIAQKWRVINVRAWNAKPQTQYGPSDWHCDGSSHYIRKLMIYPNSLTPGNGSLEIADRSGQLHRLEGDSAMCVLADVAILLHRGISAENRLRPMIEVTICPATETSTGYVYAGQNARGIKDFSPEIMKQVAAVRYVPKTLQAQPIAPKDVYPTEPAAPIMNQIGKVNIGGGPNFKHPGWLNLDGVASRRNPVPFRFAEDCMFPIASGTTQIVYSSHCLEHLNDKTVARVLSEAQRVVSPNGRLILKLPDFDLVKKSWIEQDSHFFAQWGLDVIIPTWLRRGVIDDINNRASMIYCGYWNKEYGDHFSWNINADPAAYHGPASVSGHEFAQMITTLSAHELAQALVEKVRREEIEPTFNHQNAWDREELLALLESCGFSILSLDGDAIRDEYRASIPTLDEMHDISIYCEAVVR